MRSTSIPAAAVREGQGGILNHRRGTSLPGREDRADVGTTRCGSDRVRRCRSCPCWLLILEHDGDVHAGALDIGLDDELGRLELLLDIGLDDEHLAGVDGMRVISSAHQIRP